LNSTLAFVIFCLFSAPLLNLNNNSTEIDETQASSIDIQTEVQHLKDLAPQLKPKVLSLALTAFKHAQQKEKVKKQLLTVIDYSLPSFKKRMWVFDVEADELLYATYVAHGKNSGNEKAHHFSNEINSKESSLGTYVTKGTYYGSKGYSLNLEGLERGYNDHAFDRRVVIHGAWYVEPEFIKEQGRAGRSWGCPSVAKSLAKPIINKIKGGSIVFAYYPDKNYLGHSKYIGPV
jgi:hypothetical protein